MRLTRLIPALAFLALAPAAFAQAPAAVAQELSTETIQCQLNPDCGVPRAPASHCPPGRICRNIDPGEMVAPKDNSSTVHIGFEYDSAILQNDARIQLDSLGKALVDQRLGRFTFRIEGHTDAKGSSLYNKALSKRRAMSVRNYLIQNFKNDPKRLEVEGYGSLKLLDPAHPLDGVNRRVQIVNVSVPTTLAR
jgi:outer membrane protein OmpA-like peptidoglycan-associated protein